MISTRPDGTTVLTTGTDAQGQLVIRDAGLPADVFQMVPDGRGGVYADGPDPPGGKVGLSVDHYLFHDGTWSLVGRVPFEPASGKIALVGTLSADGTQVAFATAVTTKELVDGPRPVVNWVGVFPTE